MEFNFLMNFLLKISGALFSIIYYPHVFRVLGAEYIGKVAFSGSVASFFSMIASLGIPIYGIRECARKRTNRCQLKKTAIELIVIQSIMTVFAVFSMIVSINIVSRFKELTDVFIPQIIAIAFNAINSEWFFAAEEQYGKITIRSAVAKAISAVLMFTLIRYPDDYCVYAALLSLSLILNNVFNFVALVKELWSESIGGKIEIAKHFLPVLVFFAQTVTITIYTNTDSLMIGFWCGDRWTGIYEAAIKVKLLLSFLVTGFATVMLPKLSYLVGENNNRVFAENSKKLIDITVLIAVPIAVFTMVTSKEMICALFGDAYVEASAALAVLSPTIIAIALSGAIGTGILTATGHEKQILVSCACGAAVNIIINILLIPEFGIIGAGFGTLFAELTVLLIQVYYTRSFIIDYLKNEAIKVTIASIIPIPVIIVLKSLGSQSSITTIILSAIVYFTITFAFLLAAKDKYAIVCLDKFRLIIKRYFR